MRMDLKENIGFLCGYLRSKEKSLLDEKRIAILSEVKDMEHLQAAVSGTIFHHALSGSPKDFEIFKKVESGIGAFVREVLEIGGELVMLASLKEISEGIKLSLLKRRADSTDKNHLLSCGFTEEELLDPKLAGKNVGFFAEEIIGRLFNVINGAESPYELDVRLFAAERKILKESISLYDKKFKSFVESMIKAQDMWFLYFATTLEKEYFEEICKSKVLREGISEDLKDLFSCLLREEDIKIFARNVKLKDFELGMFFENIISAESVEEARRIAVRYFDKVFARHRLFGVNYVYPFYFFKKLFEQLRIVKTSLVRVYGGREETQEERRAA